MGNLTGKMIFSCRDCTTALDMAATQTHKEVVLFGTALFEVDERPMCDGCADRLAELGFTRLLDENSFPQLICPHIAEDWAEREEWERESEAANAYVDHEAAKFIERIKRNVIKRWDDTKITSACFKEDDDYNTDAGLARIVAKHVIMAIGGECC